MTEILTLEWWLAKEIPNWLFIGTVILFGLGIMLLGWIFDWIDRK